MGLNIQMMLSFATATVAVLDGPRQDHQVKPSTMMTRQLGIWSSGSPAEKLMRPGMTTLDLVSGRKHLRAEINTVSHPARLLPGTTIGPDEGERPWLATKIDLFVDGCPVDQPMTGMTAFRDPRHVALNRSKGLWTIEIQGSGDGGFYSAVYTFNDKRILRRVLLNQGDRDETLFTEIGSPEDYGATRNCRKGIKPTHRPTAEATL